MKYHYQELIESKILNSPPAKFLIPVYKISLHVKPPSSGLIVSHVNKPYACLENRVGLDYFPNITSSGLDLMYL